MSRKKSNKNSEKELKRSISTVLVANNKNFRPFIELLEHEGENITQQQLGKLLGIFEIKDSNDDSAYIVNFLTSVVKKEYFINPRRSVTESFEAALHKINLALSEIANHGNINWLGKIDAAICVLEKNYIHFSVSGNARVMLLRKQSLTDISEGLATDEPEPHPMKTFVNVSSGKLENNDKIIITGDDLFQIFSINEIKKAALRFNREKFVQFIKTALINELEVAGTIIIDIHEEQKEQEIKKKELKKQKKAFNAFSEKTFKESISKTLKSTPKESSEKDGEYTDKKTGHIYVQGEYNGTDGDNLPDKIVSSAREIFSDLLFWVKTGAGKMLSKAKKMTSVLGERIMESKERIKKNLKNKAMEKSLDKAIKKPDFIPQPEKYPSDTKYAKSINFKYLRNILPSFSKISNIVTRMDYQQKIYSALALLIIIVAPLFLIKILNKENPVTETESPIEIAKVEIFQEDKNITLEAEIKSLISSEKLVDQIISNDRLFAIEYDKILEIEGSSVVKEYEFSSDWGKIKTASLMEDLNMLFLLTDQNKIVSFSSISNKFQENTIKIPGDSEINNFSTYLTYIYLVDSRNNQIYRYPRAEGGFGEKTDWLNDDISLENISDAVIDENIYLTNGQEIIKLFRGKKEEFNAEQSATPLKFNKIFTSSNVENIYILDNESGRIAKYSKSGELISQFHNNSLKEASGIAVDEKNSKAYFTTSKNLMSLELK